MMDTREEWIAELEHIAEYWNGNENERAMADALHHILGCVDTLLVDMKTTPPPTQASEVSREALEAQVKQLTEQLNTPEILDFAKAVNLEAAHQRERWGTDHDGGKTDADWFWLVGYLAGKALHKPEKRLHHLITAAAALANWHLYSVGKTNMRPGIEPPDQAHAAFSTPGEGVLVDEVMTLKTKGDICVNYDGKQLSLFISAEHPAAKLHVGDTVRVIVQRAGGGG